MGTGTKSVYLGNDTSLQPKYEYTGKEQTGWGWADVEDARNADRYNNAAYSKAKASAGHGTLTTWAYIARSIFIEDDSSENQAADIIAYGDYRGTMNFYDGSNYASIELLVSDETDDHTYDETIEEWIDYVNTDMSGSFNDTLRVNLEGQHTYGIILKVTTEITLDAEGPTECISDFYNDASPGILSWDSVDIDF
jgi:hypothetical protein